MPSRAQASRPGSRKQPSTSNSRSSRRSQRSRRRRSASAATSCGRPADDRPRHRALRGGVDELDRDVAEAQRRPDAGADLLHDRVDRERLGQAGRTRAAGARAPCGGARPPRRPARPARAWAAWAASADEHREVVVGRPAPGDGLVDRHDAEHVPLAVAQRHEERVLGVPGVGAVGHLEVGDEGDRLVPGPVELVPGQQEAAVALEAQVEERLPLRPGARAPEQRVAALVGAVDGLDAEVVPGRPVERDDDGAVAHGLGHGGGDRGQQRVEVVLAAHEPRDLEQAGEPRDGVGAVVGSCHQPSVIGRHRVWTEAPLDAPQRPLALSAMADQRARPEGIAGSPHAGPFPVGAYAAKLRDELRKRARVQLFGEVFGFKRRARARCSSSCATPRARVPCSMWRDDFDALGLPPARWPTARRSSSPAGRDYYPGSRTASPSFSFAVTGLRARRRGRPARPARACCASRWPPRGCSSRRSALAAPGAAARDRRGHRRERQGARRRARRPAPPRLGRAARVGLRAGAGPPRRAGDHPRAAGPRRRARRSR